VAENINNIQLSDTACISEKRNRRNGETGINYPLPASFTLKKLSIIENAKR
jgi:hypothetical protein